MAKLLRLIYIAVVVGHSNSNQALKLIIHKMSQNVFLFWPWHGFFQNTNSPRSHLAKHLATGTEGSGAESSTNSWHWGAAVLPRNCLRDPGTMFTPGHPEEWHKRLRKEPRCPGIPRVQRWVIPNCSTTKINPDLWVGRSIKILPP